MRVRLDSVTYIVVLIACCVHESGPAESATKVLIRKPRRILVSEIMTVPEIVRSRGYPVEVHNVTTRDGYVLALHRIPFGRRGAHFSVRGHPRPVVLLMHCLFCSSKDWLLNDPEKALGFILADAGYDVWMVNARGNIYSRANIRLSPEEKEFWLFSWHEIALLDLPASIDYALSVSGTNQLSYVGYSMGSAVFYALMSERPDFNQKVKVAAMLGPAAYLTNSFGAFFQFSELEYFIEKLGNLLGFWEIRPAGKLFNGVATTLCSRRNFILNELCLSVYSQLMDIDSEFANTNFLPEILSGIPSGGSLRTLIHFMQVKNEDRFQWYSYGKTQNQLVYGSPQPPLYLINKTLTPVGLFTGKGDQYVRTPDVDRLERELPNVALRFEVDNSNFSHFDFLWANDATRILYDVVLNFLHSYQI